VNQPRRNVEYAVWGGLAVVVFAIMVAFIMAELKPKALPVYGTLPGFILTNQNGQTVTLADFHGQVLIADAIFTRCPGQCLVMSAHMREIQNSLPAGPVQLVSFSTDPAFDQPAVLKKYGERFGARDNRWSFLTGDKSALHNVEVDGLKLAVLDKPAAQQEGANDLFIHSEKFVLLDKLGQIRGYYDGQTSSGVAEAVAAALTLAHE
jgi:protein SCO1/2